MASINELKNVLKETLEERGVMSQIRARIRAEIFASLNDNQSDKPEISIENMIINDLIREYMEYNNYSSSLAVFGPEAGMPDKMLDRQFIAKKLKIVEDQTTKQMPLLYGMVFGMKKVLSNNNQVPADRDVPQKENKELRGLNRVDNNKFPESGEVAERRDDFEFQGKKQPMYQDIFKQ